jgi:DnaJ-like protein
MAVETEARTEERDYYEVLGAGPSATAAELRASFRDAVLRHHPDRATASQLATRRTAVLNRAWRELRDPLRRLHYDRDLERGTAATLEWPLEADEVATGTRRRRVTRAAQPTSRWHQPQWRNVAGFRVPADVFMAGPSVQDAWIVANHISGEDWRAHTERYWLRYAAGYYRDRGRIDDWIGTLERLVELDDSFDTLVRADLRAAYVSTGMVLRGIGFLRPVAERYPASSSQRRWVDRELRALLAEFRDQRVRRGTVEDRAEAAELLLNYLEALEMEPGIPDVRAAIVALRRAGHQGRAAELVERVVSQPVTEPARWFSIVQLLTEAGQLDRASALLASLARGDHPEALDRRRIGGDPVRRIGAARRRLARARERTAGAISAGATLPPGPAEEASGADMVGAGVR